MIKDLTTIYNQPLIKPTKPETRNTDRLKYKALSQSPSIKKFKKNSKIHENIKKIRLQHCKDEDQHPIIRKIEDLSRNSIPRRYDQRKLYECMSMSEFEMH